VLNSEGAASEAQCSATREAPWESGAAGPARQPVCSMAYINDLTREEIKGILEKRGEPGYRAAQVCEWLYRGRVKSFEEMTNLPLRLRKELSRDFRIVRLREETMIESREDGAVKYLLRPPDRARIESVILNHPRGATLCVSTQVGCAYGCAFCATGTMKYKRDLTPGEITDQVSYLEERLAERAGAVPQENIHPDAPRHFANVVFMGMGEPFANYAYLTKAVHIMIEEMGIGARRITISTCGLADEIMRFAREPYEVGLAVSLNAATDQKRREIMPVAKKVSLPELMNAARYYFAAKGRLLTFEYVLMDGVNDSVHDAHELAGLLRDLPAKINLISLNPFPGCRFGRPDPARVRKFQSILEDRGRKVTLRRSLGSDILAGCGQLGARRLKRGQGR
jgi:23S rRNA (adenine2503-C2)-methyltransferase